jgi:hypothetical protein
MLPMRFVALAVFASFTLIGQVSAQPAPPSAPGAKRNANPCSDEVAAALQKLRKSSWFRMDSRMITENGPTSMQVDYVLPDRMHQTIKVEATQKTTEVILVGDAAWSREGEGSWHALPPTVVGQLKGQMQESVLQQQTDVGSYACKGRTQLDGRDVMSYKLDSEPEKGSTASTSQTFRMFYIDALTGLPVSNTLLVTGHEERPIFKTTYSFPLDLKIEPPTDVAGADPSATATGGQ